MLNPQRRYGVPVISLDSKYYKLIDQMESRFPYGPPSLIECERFTVKGDVRFGPGVVCRGTVEVVNEARRQLVITEDMSHAAVPLSRGREAPRSSDLASSRTAWLFFGVLLVALVVRAWGIDFGLPYLYHPDEPGEVAIIQHMFKTGDLNPHAFHYASLFYYLNLLLYVPYFLFEKLAGALQSPTDLPDAIRLIGGSGKTLAPGTMVLGRSLSIALGVGTVALLFVLVRDFTGKTLWGALAALWLAVSPTHVEHSRYITPDVMMTFFFTLTLWASWRIYRRGRTRDYVLAGVALGLTVASKYNGAPVLVAILLAHFLRSGSRGIHDWRLYLTFGVSALSFILAMPYALLDTKTFLADCAASKHPTIRRATRGMLRSSLRLVPGLLSGVTKV